MNAPDAVVGVVVFTAIGASLLTLVKAVASRIAGHAPSQDALRDLRDEVAQLRGELDAVHSRLAGVDEMQERLDFAERMIAAQKQKNELPGLR